ncbi:MAG: AMP-binding protein [Deltaproteobacteria bacterium]|nr:AMP-binding protein [Deltaproteobacteria bacterium]
MSYAELARRAADVAGALVAAGIAPGDRVALLSAKRRHDEPVALAGVLTAQAIAVPLDASSPAGRLGTIVKQCGCRALVHDEPGAALAEACAGDGLRLVLDEGGAIVASQGTALQVDAPADPATACILHTSGSTGKPKAIPISWAGLDAFTTWMIDLTELRPADRVLRVAELVFDLSWFDHLATFRAGATLCTTSRRCLATGRSLLGELETLAPTIVYGVPALFTKLVAALPEDQQLDPGLRVICFAGEVFPLAELRRLAARAPRARLFNLFGPTETNVCTFHEVDRTALVQQPELPIGRPCPYAPCELVADDGSVIAGPGIGELVVGGPTALGGRCHTGDRVERGSDSLLYFRGRLDRLVKIQGYRLEPGEIEAALLDHPQVQEAAVVVADHPRLGKTVQAFVALRPADEPATSRALRQHLASRLAPYMVPGQITAVEALPRTTTGKIDYPALQRHQDGLVAT